jgi:hypothetical protein
LLLRGSILALFSSVSLFAQTIAPAPNWGVPLFLNDAPLTANLNNGQLETPFAPGACTAVPAAGINFQFDIYAADPQNKIHGTSTLGAISTSAVVVDATGRLVATLWNGVSIPNGTNCGTWNGNPDDGEPLTSFTGPFTIKVQFNNVQYTWDGVVGVNENSLAGPDNWDSAGSFPPTMSFIKVPSLGNQDFAFVGGGYNEGRLEGFVFSDPSRPSPINLALQSGGEFDYSATDGENVYFIALSYCCNGYSAVVGFTPTTTIPPTSPSTAIPTYGSAPWGNPYIFTDLKQALPPKKGVYTYFTNAAADVVLDNSSTVHDVNGDPVLPYFDNGIATGPFLTTALTGIAVQRSGNLLAVSHGLFLPQYCDSTIMNQNSISLYDKKSGAHLATLRLGLDKATGVPINPQKMVFDTNPKGDELWIIDGGQPAVSCDAGVATFGREVTAANPDPVWATHGHLYRGQIIESNGAYRIDLEGPIQLNGTLAPKPDTINPMGLSNPIDVAVSTRTGHIFVADGGSNQQVYEFDRSTLDVASVTGEPGGYGQSTARTCNATIHDNVFWFDYIPVGIGTTRPWMTVDNEDGIWIGDYTTSRVLHFTRSSSSEPYSYHNGINMNRWLDYVAVPSNTPNRVFGGPGDMLEYSVSYPDPDPAASATPLTGNTAFNVTRVRNWLPCFFQAEGRLSLPGMADPNAILNSVETVTYPLAGGEPRTETLGTVDYHGGLNGGKNTALLSLPVNGTISVVNNRITPPEIVWLDSNGSYYHYSATKGGVYTIRRYDIIGSEADSFPKWDSIGTPIATVAPNKANGEPTPQCFLTGCIFVPTKTNGIVPIYAGGVPGKPTNLSSDPPVYHLAGVPSTGESMGDYAWHTQLEYDIEYPALTNDANRAEPSTTPANNLGIYSNWGTYAGPQYMGFGVQAANDFIFTGINGNGQEYSCQFNQYTDDGMMIGQFGWRGAGYPIGNSVSGGHPDVLKVQALAPGYCANPGMFKVITKGVDSTGSPSYYLYVSDSAYRAGPQRWHIWNTGSIRKLTGTAALKSVVTLN